MLTSCSSTQPNLSAPTASYQKGLQTAQAAPALSGPDEQAAVDALKRMFNTYTPEALKQSVPEVYADTVFFRDGFKELNDIESLTAYFVHSSESLRSCTFDFQPHISGDGNVYLPWTMTFSLKRDKEGESSSVLGMTHLRFNEQGKVIFHQDYWDPTDSVWRRIPLAGWLIQKVRARL